MAVKDYQFKVTTTGAPNAILINFNKEKTCYTLTAKIYDFFLEYANAIYWRKQFITENRRKVSGFQLLNSITTKNLIDISKYSHLTHTVPHITAQKPQTCKLYELKPESRKTTNFSQINFYKSTRIKEEVQKTIAKSNLCNT